MIAARQAHSSEDRPHEAWGPVKSSTSSKHAGRDREIEIGLGPDASNNGGEVSGGRAPWGLPSFSITSLTPFFLPLPWARASTYPRHATTITVRGTTSLAAWAFSRVQRWKPADGWDGSRFCFASCLYPDHPRHLSSSILFLCIRFSSPFLLTHPSS